MNPVTNRLFEHYSQTFEMHGETSKGVDWGEDAERVDLRHQNMTSLFQGRDDFSLVDIGCGFGDFKRYLDQQNIDCQYTGIDVVGAMIESAKARFPECDFICDDFLNLPSEIIADYLVCNGILTQKLSVSHLEMVKFSHEALRKMFSLCGKGLAFNVMSNRVNFFSSNLFYMSPTELLTWCMEELSNDVKIDHSYGLFEFTVYVYKTE